MRLALGLRLEVSIKFETLPIFAFVTVWLRMTTILSVAANVVLLAGATAVWAAAQAVGVMPGSAQVVHLAIRVPGVVHVLLH